MTLNKLNIRFLTALSTRVRWVAVSFLVTVALSGCDWRSSDSVTELASPAGAGSAEPHLAKWGSSALVLSWLEPENDGIALRYARWLDGSWGPAHTVTTGNNWFVNWADFPSVTPVSKDLWAAHWLVKKPGGTYAYDVAVALSRDTGDTWSQPVAPHSDGTRTEHGFVSLYPERGGVGVLWLDGRQMAEDSVAGGGHAKGGMTLRSATVKQTGDVGYPRLVDDLVCDCCQTDVAIATAGPVAVYRNRTDEEIRDVYIARFVDDDWLPGLPVANDGWQIHGCPVNGPAVVADGDAVSVAWFTAANDRPKVRAALSLDGGATFATVIDIDVEQPIGRVDIDFLDTKTIVVSWLRKGLDNKAEIVARSVLANGIKGPVRIIAQTNNSRATGFPQMTRYGDDLVFAWTDTSDKPGRVRTARLGIDAFR